MDGWNAASMLCPVFLLSDRVSALSRRCRYILELLKADLKPRDIMTYKAFENAMVTIMATGGGTAHRAQWHRTQAQDTGMQHYVPQHLHVLLCMCLPYSAAVYPNPPV